MSISILFFTLKILMLSEVRSIRPLIGTVEHLRRELAWGMPLRKRTLPSRHTHSPLTSPHTPVTPRSPDHTLRYWQSPPITPLPTPPLPFHNPITEALEVPAQALGTTLLEAMQCIEKTIILAFHQADPPARLFSWKTQPSAPPSPDVSAPASPTLKQSIFGADHHGWTYRQIALIQKTQTDLVTARDNAREQLRMVFRELYMRQRKAESNAHIPKEALSCCLAMIALLQVRSHAHESRV